jgi:hypothetical protein
VVVNWNLCFEIREYASAQQKQLKCVHYARVFKSTAEDYIRFEAFTVVWFSGLRHCAV